MLLSGTQLMAHNTQLTAHNGTHGVCRQLNGSLSNGKQHPRSAVTVRNTKHTKYNGC